MGLVKSNFNFYLFNYQVYSHALYVNEPLVEVHKEDMALNKQFSHIVNRLDLNKEEINFLKVL